MKRRIRKTIMSFGIIFSLVISSININFMHNIVYADANDIEIWDGTVASSFAGGDGTESNPYQISNGSELAYFSKCVNEGETFSGKYVEVTKNIYMNSTSDYETWSVNNPPKNRFDIIGSSYSTGKCFNGNFNGNGFVVDGIYVNSEIEGKTFSGFFAALSNANVENIRLEHEYVYGGTYTGGIAGMIWGGNGEHIIRDITVSGKINGNSSGGYVGGFFGSVSTYWDHLIIENCICYGEINSSRIAGGIIGATSSSSIIKYCIDVKNCKNYASIISMSNTVCIGGIVGDTWLGHVFILRCANYGEIDGGDAKSVGGIVGDLGQNNNCCSYIRESFNAGTIMSSSQNCNNGGIVGMQNRSNGEVKIIDSYNIGKAENGIVDARSSSSDLINVYNYYHEDDSNVRCISSGTYATNGCYNFGEGEYTFSDKNVCVVLDKNEFADEKSFTTFDFDTIWVMNAALGRPVLRNNMEEASGQGIGNYSGIIEAVKKYSTDNETLKKMILAISEKDLPYDIKMQLMSSVCMQYGFDDVQEGIDYVQDASSAQRAYQTLINNEQYGCWQFGYYLNNTTKGKVARGLLYANGMIFNDELGDWLDPGTYVDSEFPGIKKYKTLLSKFIQDNASEFEVYSKASEVVSIVNDMKKIKDIDDDSAIDATLDKLFEASPEEQDEIINRIFKDNLLVLTETDTETGNDISYITTKDEAFCKAFGISSKTFKVITDGTKDILEFINFSTKMKLYEEYTDFFNEIIGAEDLPFELRAAASELKMEMESGYLEPIKDLLLHGLKNGCELSDEIDKVTEDKVIIEKGELSNVLGEATKTIKIGAFFTNLLVDMGGVVKNAAYTNGYAYLTAHYANVLEESRIEFNKNQTEENAWDFYTKYNMLYKLRIEGEKSYLELNELSPDGIMGWGGFLLKYAFDYSSKKELVEYNTNYLKNNCKFQLPENIAVPEYCQYAQKAVVNCPVDVEIINSEGVSIAKIMDGEESDITNSYGRFISQYKPYTNDYTKIIYLKDDGPYEYKIIGKDDGDVSLKMTSQDGTISGFTNVNIHKDDVIFVKSQNSDTYDIDIADDGTIDETYELDKEIDDSIVLLKSLQISDEILELEVGEKHSLTYTFEPLNAYNNQVSWEVIDNNIASVSEAGEVLAKEVGTTDIYCISTSRDNNDDLILKKCKVSVKKEQPSETTEPSETEAPSGTPKPSATAKPSETEAPSGTPKPSGTEAPSGTPKPSGTEIPSGITEPNGTSNLANSSSSNKWSPAVGKSFTDSSKNAVYKITKLGSTNTVEYMGCKNKNAKNVSVPSVVRYKTKVYKVTSIGQNAFAKNKKLQKIVLGKNIASIKNKAFYKCKKLSVVKLNSKLKIIGKQAFQGCSNITLLTLPKNLQKIGDKSFYGCSKLQYIMIKSKKLTKSGIGALSFAKCNKKVRVKTAKSKWRLYARVMITKAKISSKATFVINPVPLIQ